MPKNEEIGGELALSATPAEPMISPTSPPSEEKLKTKEPSMKAAGTHHYRGQGAPPRGSSMIEPAKLDWFGLH